MNETDRPDGTQGMALNDLLCFAVYGTDHAFARVYRPYLDKLQLTYPQFLVMMALAETPRASVGEIGRRLGIEGNTLTPVLKRMEGAGLIRRSRDTADERRVWVEPTDVGAALLPQVADVPSQIAANTGLSHAELQDLTDRLCHVRDRLLKV